MMMLRLSFRKKLAAAVCTGFAASASFAQDTEPFPGWSFFGANTLRLETYNNSGDQTASPYPFEGGQYYNELGVNFEKRYSPYDLFRGQIYGVINASDYRSLDRGVVPERVNFTREKGDVAIPWRAEAGDYFAYYSYLTMQRSLKGLQIELQPHLDSAGRRHSLLFSAGALQSAWGDFAPHADNAAGASWLIDMPSDGSVSLNFVASHQDGDAAQGLLDRDQYTFSLAGEQLYRTASQQITFEGELAHFVGDHNGLSTPASGQDREGNGVFAEMRGFALTQPLDYRARFEYYTQDFQPRAGVITSDRRSIEFHSGWRFASGLRLSGRVQAFEDGFETTNSLDTRTVGATLAGPLWTSTINGLTGSIDVFAQTLDDTSDSIDQRIINANINLTKPLPYDWFGRFSVFVQDLDDRNTTDVDQLINQYHLSADHSFSIGSFTGIITPGLLYRNILDSSQADEWSPTLALQLGRGAHALNFNYGLLAQDRHFTGGINVNTHSLAADYRYSRGRHTLGAEANFFAREPDPGAHTDAYRVGVFWSYSLDRPASAVARQYDDLGTPISAPVSADLFALAPGVGLTDANGALTAAGIVGGATQVGATVYETALLREIEQRQRLVLLHETGILSGSALIVDAVSTGSTDDLPRLYERVRKALLDRYGTPTSSYAQGEFSASAFADINSQRVIRVDEWSTAGGVLRLGIPRRLDGQVRIEIQHRQNFALPRDTLWSIESVR